VKEGGGDYRKCSRWEGKEEKEASFSLFVSKAERRGDVARYKGVIRSGKKKREGGGEGGGGTTYFPFPPLESEGKRGGLQFNFNSATLSWKRVSHKKRNQKRKREKEEKGFNNLHLLR